MPLQIYDTRNSRLKCAQAGENTRRRVFEPINERVVLLTFSCIIYYLASFSLLVRERGFVIVWRVFFYHFFTLLLLLRPVDDHFRYERA